MSGREARNPTRVILPRFHTKREFGFAVDHRWGAICAALRLLVTLPALPSSRLPRQPIDRPNQPRLIPPLAAAQRPLAPILASAQLAAKSAPQIAAELGCTPSQVFGALRRAGIARRRREEYAPMARGWRTWPADVQERAVALYCAGWSAPTVAKI